MFSIRCMSIPIKQVTSFKLHTRKHSSRYDSMRFFKKNLVMINITSSGICMGLGDIIQQEREYQQGILKERYDWKRLVRMFIMGMGMGPLHHYYYVQLDRMLPASDLKTVITKIILDQLVASPIMIVYFFYTLGLLEQKPLRDVTVEIKEKTFYLYTRDCMYWPPVQFINFYFLPSPYRVVYINIATMLYNIFLSYVKHDYENKPVAKLDN